MAGTINSDDSDDSEFKPTTPARVKKSTTSKRKKKSRTDRVAESSGIGIDRAPLTPRRPRVKTGKAIIRRAEAVVRSEKGKGSKKTKKSLFGDEIDGGEEEGEAKKDLHPIVAQEDESSIFAAVRRGTVALTTVTDEWIDRYSENALDAIAELMTFIVNSSGCPESITAEMLRKGDEHDFLDEVVPNLVEKFPEVSEYPLISTHKSLKDFTRNFLEFWEVLFNRSKDSVLFQEAFIDTLVSWISSLSSSSVRAFRHTTTVALFQFVDTFIHLLKDMKKELDQLQKQIKSTKGSEKQLQRQADTLRRRMEMIRKNISNIFDGVFVHRYKDSVENIRALAMDSLGGWISSDPEHFLQDGITRYLGWCLNDRSPAVRECVLKALAKIYDHEDWHGLMALFTKKFLDRIVQIATSDASVPVSIEALKLLTALLRFGVLSTDDESHLTHIKKITSLIQDENASVRHYAAHFIFFNLATITEDEKKRKRRSSKKKKKTLDNSDISLKDILSLMTEYHDSCPSIAVYVVDAFWNLTHVFEEWETMCHMLLGTAEDADEDDEGEELSDEESSNMILALNAAVKKLHGSLGKFTTAFDTVKLPTRVKRKGKGKKKKTKTEEEEEREDQIETMTSVLAPMLPQLIAKYQSDREKIEDLVEMPRFFNLDTYTSNRLQHHFDELLKLLADLFWKHSDLSTFKKIAQTFHFLTTSDFTLKSRAEGILNQIERQMVERLRTAVGAFEEHQDSTDNTEGKQEKYAILLSLQRILSFIQLMDFRLEELFKDMGRLLSARIRGADLDADTCALAIGIMMCYFGWKMHDIMQRLQRDSDPVTLLEPVEFNNLVKSKSTFTRQLLQLMDVGDFELETASFRSLCDFFTLFPTDVPELEALQVAITDEEREGLIEFFHKSLAKRAEIVENPAQFDDDDDDDETEGDELTSVEERVSNAIKNMQLDVAALAKAFINGTLPTDKAAGAMLSHFASHGKNVSDTIKHVHGKLREQEPDSLWLHEFEALKIMFDRYAEEEETEDAYNQFCTLAARLSLLHFWGRDQDLVYSLVRNVVQDAFDEISVRHRFLTGISGFVTRLERNDASSILLLVGDKIEELHSFDEESDDVKESVEEFKRLLRHIEQGRKSQQQRAKKEKKRARKEQDEEKEEQDDDNLEEEVERFPEVSPPRSKRPRRKAARRLDFGDEDEEQVNEEDEEQAQEDERTDLSSQESESLRSHKRRHTQMSAADDDETQISEDPHDSELEVEEADEEEEAEIKQTRTKRRRKY